MKKTAKIIILCVFLGFISFFFALNIVLPDTDFSQRENRYLQQAPDFSFRDLFSGKYTESFESYTTDQFAFRDAWITLKARCELFVGKKENNSVYLCEDGSLIERFSAPKTGKLKDDVSAINDFAEAISSPVYFALIPGAVDIQSDKLPTNAPTDSQSTVIDKAYASSNVTTIDIASTLSEHADEYIFYRTDHHWTSLGAFYGYCALCQAWGMPEPELADYERTTVSDCFYGTVYSSSGFSWVESDTIETFVPDDGSAVITNYNSADPKKTPLYDTSYLLVKDKYSMFLGGTTPKLIIETGNADKPTLLIIRDSYADSLVPFLLKDFSEIHILDLRYYKGSVSRYASEHSFDKVLIIYSVSNFSKDTNLSMLSVNGDAHK